MVPIENFEQDPSFFEQNWVVRKRSGDNTPDFDGLWATRG